MSRKLTTLLVGVLLCLLCCAVSAEEAEVKTFANVNEAVAWVTENQPAVLDVGKAFKFDDLVKIRQAMPEGAELRFNIDWFGHNITNDMEEITFKRKGGGITAQFLRNLIDLCPRLRMINTQARRWLENDVFIPLVDEHPEIDFQWIIRIRCYYIPSNATAFSTLKGSNSKVQLTSRDCEMLRYAPNLLALDLGHNKIRSLDFLRFFPHLKLLIIALNPVSDISILSDMMDLEYVELFSTRITDLTPLANHTKLLDLNLSWCPLTDFTPLDSCTNLERLWLNKIKISPEVMETIRAAHPDCEISHTHSHETADGWRWHWRYKQYKTVWFDYTWHDFVPPENK